MPPATAPPAERDAVWSEVRERLRGTLNTQTYKFAFAGATPGDPGRRPHRPRRSTPSCCAQWIRQRYLPLIRDALFEVRGTDLEVDIIVVEGPSPGGRLPEPRRRRRRPPRRPDDRPARPARHRAPAALHLRGLRHRPLQPVRPRGRPGRGRDARPGLQPVLHLRRGRAGQDPPAARHRALRERQPPGARAHLRLGGDVHQRVHQRPARRRHPLVQGPLPQHGHPPHRRHPVAPGPRADPGGVLPHVQRAPRQRQADRDLVGPSPQGDRDPGGPPAQPLRDGPHHRRAAPRRRDAHRHPPEAGARGPLRDPRSRGAVVHRRPRVHQRPRAGGRPHAGGRPRVDLRPADHRGARPRGPRGPLPRRRGRHQHRGDPGRGLPLLRGHPGRDGGRQAHPPHRAPAPGGHVPQPRAHRRLPARHRPLLRRPRPHHRDVRGAEGGQPDGRGRHADRRRGPHQPPHRAALRASDGVDSPVGARAPLLPGSPDGRQSGRSPCGGLGRQGAPARVSPTVPWTG